MSISDLIRARLESGRTIADADVRALLAERDRAVQALAERTQTLTDITRWVRKRHEDAALEAAGAYRNVLDYIAWRATAAIRALPDQQRAGEGGPR